MGIYFLFLDEKKGAKKNHGCIDPEPGKGHRKNAKGQLINRILIPLPV
jgi:hypothetical protein